MGRTCISIKCLSSLNRNTCTGSCDRKVPFENSRPSTTRILGQPMHSQSANFGKFKLNSLNLASFLLLNPIGVLRNEIFGSNRLFWPSGGLSFWSSWQNDHISPRSRKSMASKVGRSQGLWQYHTWHWEIHFKISIFWRSIAVSCEKLLNSVLKIKASLHNFVVVFHSFTIVWKRRVTIEVICTCARVSRRQSKAKRHSIGQ